jgi:hypothetical protein
LRLNQALGQLLNVYVEVIWGIEQSENNRFPEKVCPSGDRTLDPCCDRRGYERLDLSP